MSDRPEWFAAKRFGYGAGLPIAWQGWTLLIGFLAIVTVLPVVIRSVLVTLSIVAPLTAGFLIICRNTTRGGWRWRSGEENEL